MTALTCLAIVCIAAWFGWNEWRADQRQKLLDRMDPEKWNK